MSKIKYLSAFLLLFTAFNFISCEDIEPIDSTIVLNPDPGCVSPTSFRASDFVNGTNINLNWVAGGEEESWEIQYGISGFTLGNGTSIFSESTNLTIANLISTNSYQFYVRSNCSENEVSSWVGPIVVNSSSNNNCATPVTVSAIRSATNTEITLNWNSAGQETSWEVQYGATGFGLGSGTIVVANARSIQVSGLVPATSYDFYVRAICSPTEKSNWTAVSTVLGTNPGGGTTGDYWPTAINNQWTFSQNGTTQDPMKMIGTDIFNGATYYKFAPQSGSGGGSTATDVDTWLNKNNGIYSLKTGDLDISAGGLTGVQTGFEYIILKDNLAVNQTWNGSYSQSTSYAGIPAIVQTTTYTGKILEKDVTAVVNGRNYTNVIKVSITQLTSFMGVNSTVVTEYWFSKNVGPIKTKTVMEGQTYESILVNYTLN